MKTPEHLISSIDRPLGVRARRDLQITTTVFQGERSWIVKDPVALKYYRMREAEYEVFQLLDGESSFRDIQDRLKQRFPQTRLGNHQLQSLIESFYAGGLLISTAAGQASPLARRRGKLRRQKALGTMQSIVSIRFPGVDPERFLTWLYARVGWCFSQPAVAFCLAIILGAVTLLATHWAEFQARLPAFEQFFAIDNLLMMVLLLIVTKTLHELGHGLVCKHFGGECHEIGFMLLVLTPAMYCNTTDSWVLPNKWHRIAIGAAGMWVEIVLASICTFLWWYTHPGWLHFMSLNLMFLCGVSTLVFNINPLLRYDGYYMLSDYLEIPNLSKKSSTALINCLRVYGLGMEPMSGPMPEQRQWAFAAYSVASFLYRWLVIVLIFLFLTKVFQPYGLAAIGYLAVSISIFGMVVIPIFRLIKHFRVPGRMRQIKRPRAAISVLMVATALAAVVFVPLPHHVTADLVIQPGQMQSVFVDWPGTLGDVRVRHGQPVQRGDLIAQLENPELELTIARLEMRRATLAATLEAKRREQTDLRQSNQSLETARRIGELRAELLTREKQLAIHHELKARLTLVADRDGVVIPPPNKIPSPDDDVTLAKWSDRPLDPENAAARLERKTLVCYVGDPQQMSAMLALPQSAMRYVRAGQPAEIVVHSFRGERLEGVVTSVSKSRLLRLPRELSSTNGGPIAPAASGPNEAETPMLPTYEAEIEMAHIDDLPMLPGMTGKAKISVGKTPLATRIYRYLATLFRFQ